MAGIGGIVKRSTSASNDSICIAYIFSGSARGAEMLALENGVKLLKLMGTSEIIIEWEINL